MSHYTQNRIACDSPIHMLADAGLVDALRTWRFDCDSEYGEGYLNIINADNDIVEIHVEQWDDAAKEAFRPIVGMRLDHKAAALLARSILHAIDCSS